MYIYYILRRKEDDQEIELDGDVTPELFPGVDLSDGPAVINFLVKKLQAEGATETWEECELTESAFDSENSYINFHDRWIRRSDAPWRKDRSN